MIEENFNTSSAILVRRSDTPVLLHSSGDLHAAEMTRRVLQKQSFWKKLKAIVYAFIMAERTEVFSTTFRSETPNG
jgi:hypothetical protein